MHAQRIADAKALSQGIRETIPDDELLVEERSAAQQIMQAAVDLEAANLKRAALAANKPQE
jgi:hypothetical protein